MTNGASEAISTAMNGFLQPGDVVLCPSPAFGLYKNLTQINEATFVEINTEKENYKLTAKVLEQYLNKYKARVKMFILNYPNNPTGVTYSEGELKQLANVLTKFSVVVLTDEIYSELSYEEKHVSLARFLPEQTLLVNGVSKSYAMTGWRVGYLCGPEKAIANLGKIHQANVATIGTLNMLAAEEAIKNGDQDIEKMRLEYRKRRNYVCKRLKEIGMDFVSAQGAFYIYVKIPISFTGSSIDYARKLANEAHIAVIPGAAFVENDQKCFRISYAASMENLAEALRRLEKFVKGR
ncbi:pyridoxal phosphate-dependent aminotransferase [Liquorilactobacillus vini]|uniref:pyridoxal phosphate-dependent aminotransferase n=1 Tax=Liquorilactobacillus vini TaxID=238015 RepID=UPI00031D4CE9|nr:aminotransferase class I/II-fold pyridoxal phosphate-dependent enzyme [Liquorilactobacillus vini]